MAQRLKTIQHAFPVLASLVNNTLTNFTQITVYLPEGTKTIKKAWVEISMDDIITNTGGSLTTKTINLRLAAVAYTSTTNGNTLTHSGENHSFFFERDFTSHFTTNWSGTSMTCDVQLQINQSTGTTTGFVNACCILNVTYEYDDAATTQLKTVWIPLNAPVTTLPVSKTSHDTIPALDTYLPESSKTYRNIFIVTQANTNQAAATDHTVTYELSSLGTHVTGNYESGLITDRWSRYVWNITSYITTNTTHTFNVHSSLTARHHSMQVWLVVTYEFDASATTSVLNSLILPMEVDSPMGGTSAADFQRSTRELFIQESNISGQKIACYVFWQNNANEAGLNARVGTGSFVAYTNTGAGVVSGNKALMIRNDSPTGITLARGRNSLLMDIYNTSATARGGNIGSFWIINYTSDKHSLGVGAHNHTVLWPVYLEGTVAAAQTLITTAGAIDIPESSYYITAMGVKLEVTTQNTTPVQGFSVKAERLSGTEGGLIFENIYSDVGMHDSEGGLYTCIAQTKDLFQRWPGDSGNSRLFLESGRRYVLNSSNASSFFNSLTLMTTYHSILYGVSGNITNSNGGTVNIDLLRYNTKEKVSGISRSGNGSYNFTWYDNTEPMCCVAYENNTYKGMSGSGLAT